MKRRRHGWPPNSHVHRAFSHAATIDRALRDAERRRADDDIAEYRNAGSRPRDPNQGDTDQADTMKARQ